MAEDTGITAPQDGGTETNVTNVAPPEFELSKYVGADGGLLTGWKEGLLPEDLRAEKFYDNFFDIKSILKTAGTNAKLIGKKGVVVPTEKSTPSEIDEFHRALGRPDKPEGYKLEIPKDVAIQDYYDAELIKQAREIFHKAPCGFNQKQVDTLWAFEEMRIRKTNKLLDDFEAKEAEEAERIIREESGDAYDSRLHLANRVISEGTQSWTAEKKDKLLAALNESLLKPYIMDLLANTGKKFMEHKIISEPETGTGMTPDMARTEIAKIEATPGFMIADAEGKLMKNDGRIELYKSLAAERDRLYRIANAGQAK